MRFVDPDGMWPFPDPFRGAIFGQAKSLANEAYGQAKNFVNGGWKNVAAYTDANDAVVIVTTLTRGNDAVNIDGTKATTGDRVAAVAGAIIPGISGGTFKKISDKVGLTDQLIKAADNIVEAIRKVGEENVHGNSLSSNVKKFLYKKFDSDGNFLKWGKTQNLDTRYTKEQLNGGFIEEYDSGSASEIHVKERNKVETDPGPENKEPWAGKKK
jgi:hypothetical protein